jgi:hypothetical protein
VRDSNSSSMERVSVNPTIQFPVVAVVGRLWFGRSGRIEQVDLNKLFAALLLRISHELEYKKYKFWHHFCTSYFSWSQQTYNWT